MDHSAATHAASNLSSSLPPATDSWIYLFSKFTHEAMLFEALAIFLGIFGYAIFYLIRKRKYGVAGREVPENLVRVYLAQLVADAEEMRTQLFGLLGKGDASAKLMASLQLQTANLAHAPAADASASSGAGATSAGASTPSPQILQDPKLQEKMRELERKLAEQANSLDSVLNEKMRLEEELANAKSDARAPNAPAAANEKSGALQERVKHLESQLAEYAIIEDDLANLKRLQKENKALRQQIAEGGGPGSAAPAMVQPPKAAALASANAGDGPTLGAAPKAPPLPVSEGQKGEDIATELVESAANDHDSSDFASLVDVVEKNLADAATSGEVAGSAAPAAPDFKLDPGALSEKKQEEKSEEQLQADFEKMLNS